MTSSEIYRKIEDGNQDRKNSPSQMKTFEKLEDRHVKRADAVPVNRHRTRTPGRAAAMSIVPGLGQLYNGETGKGLLFLAASIANLVLFLMMFCTEPVMKGVIHVGSVFNLSPSADMNRILQIVHGSPTVCILYILLILGFVAYSMCEAYDHAKQLEKGRAFAPFFLGLSEATSGSFLVHFALMFIGIIMVAFCATPLPPQKQATDIQLIPPEPPPEPPKPKKEPDPPKPKVEEPKKQIKEQPKKVEPPKPTRVAVAVPTKDPTPSPIVQSNEPAPEAAPTAPATADTNGSPNGTGEPTGDNGGGGGDDVDFGSYLAEVQKRIKKNWFPPRGSESKSVTLKFKVRKDGTVGAAIKLVVSSGVAPVDDAAKTAIKNASPFPPLPAGSPDEIDIKFTFDYNVFNGKGGGGSAD